MLIEAAETDRRLPSALRRTPGAYWPETVPEWMTYASETTRTRLARASAEQISNYDFVHDVVLNVTSVEDRQLLWAVATSAAYRQRGPAWSKIARIRHTDRRRVKSVYEAVIIDAVMSWNDAVAA